MIQRSPPHATRGPQPPDRRVPADSNPWTDAVGDGAAARVVEAVVQVAEIRPRADGGVPGRVVHFERLEVPEVYYQRADFAADAVGPTTGSISI